MYDDVLELTRPCGGTPVALVGRLNECLADDVDTMRRSERRPEHVGFSGVAGITLSPRRSQRAAAVDPLAALMTRICDRDETALQALHATASNQVFASVLRIAHRHELADEIVSATFLQVWRTASTFDAGRATVMTWLLTIARSRAIDALRRHRIQCQHECLLDDDDEGNEGPGDGTQCPQHCLELSQLRRRLAAAMCMLSPIQRQVLTMTFLGGDSHEEVALRTGMPLGTVKSHARRGIAALRASSWLRIDAA